MEDNELYLFNIKTDLGNILCFTKDITVDKENPKVELLEFFTHTNLCLTPSRFVGLYNDKVFMIPGNYESCFKDGEPITVTPTEFLEEVDKELEATRTTNQKTLDMLGLFEGISTVENSITK